MNVAVYGTCAIIPSRTGRKTMPMRIKLVASVSTVDPCVLGVDHVWGTGRETFSRGRVS